MKRKVSSSLRFTEENVRKFALELYSIDATARQLVSEIDQNFHLKHEIIGDVRGMGLFLGIELVLDQRTLAPAEEQATEIIERTKDQGILLSIDGPLANVLKIKPPLVFSEANADVLVSTLGKIVAELKEQ